VDTNRDGAIQPVEDEYAEDDWSGDRGAIYSVNFDRDGERMVNGMPIPDSIHFDSQGNPVYEDFHIENGADELDIAPLVIRKIADHIPAGYSVVLRAAEPEDLRRIHIFKKISSEPTNPAIWGNATGESAPLEIDITPWVDPGSPTFQGDVTTGDTTFGIEGLFFRYVGSDVPEKLQFDGYIDLALELRRGETVVSTDAVRLKVAPWIMLSADQASEQIWSAAVGLRGQIAHGGGDRFADGETFSISDGLVQKTFELDFATNPGVSRGNIPVLASGDFSIAEIGRAISEAINRVDDFSIQASIRANGFPGDIAPSAVGYLELASTDLRVSNEHLMPATETVADPRFRIVGLGGLTNRAFLRSQFADEGYGGLDQSSQLQEVIGQEAQNQWFQDHVEIGYTERPGGPKTQVVFRLPYWRGTTDENPIWPMTHLLANDVGVFQLGVSLGGGSGDFGGNLEVLPPNPTAPAGRIVMGNRGSTKLPEFLTSQEIQTPIIDLPVEWLELGHVDEVVSLLARGQVALADPATAWSLLAELPEEVRGSSVFFASGTVPMNGTASADSLAANRIETGIDHRGQTWKYIRIYEGAAAGSVARIETLGDGFITVKDVWNTGSKIIDGNTPNRDINYWRKHRLPTAPSWGDSAPRKGDKYVLVEETQFWRSGTPAVVTLAEVLADDEFEKLNTIDVQSVMDQTRQLLIAQTPSETLTFIKLPSLFFGSREGAGGRGFLRGRSAVAFNPGPANLQEVDGKLYIGRQFGPRGIDGNDVLEQAIAAALRTVVIPSPSVIEDTARPAAGADDVLDSHDPGSTIIGTPEDALSTAEQAGIIGQWSPSSIDVVFVDDWDLYHTQLGNVHCGTVVRRAVPEFPWWNTDRN
jgi:hypothetical protein